MFGETRKTTTAETSNAPSPQQQPLQSSQPQLQQHQQSPLKQHQPQPPIQPFGQTYMPIPLWQQPTPIQPAAKEDYVADLSKRVELQDKKQSSEETAAAEIKPWLKKKVPGFKVSKITKRRRQNAKLKKMLQPKNALMVLHELASGIEFTFKKHTSAVKQTVFVVDAEVNGNTYIGKGLSKRLAKENAAENALKTLILEKMSAAVMRVPQENSEAEQMSQNINNPSESTTEGNDQTPPSLGGDVPWESLASFALYKLFRDWQRQEANLSLPYQGSTLQIPAPFIPGVPSPMGRIPNKHFDEHPVMFLNRLKPGIQFKEVRRDGTPPHITFTFSVTVYGETYTGIGKSKKEARKEAARAALAEAYNLQRYKLKN